MDVLIVSPFCSPDKNVGAIRMSSLIRYLIKAGYHIMVLTNQKAKPVDINFLQKVEYVDVIYNDKENSHYHCFIRNQEAYCSAFLSFITNNHVDLVIISGGPFYTFKISKLAKKNNIPCVLDYRDPWTFDDREYKGRMSVLSYIIDAYKSFFERSYIKDASAIVTVTPSWVSSFKKKYKCISDKTYLIENGFDDELLSTLSLRSSTSFDTSLLNIGVFGKLFYYSIEYSRLFLDTIKDVPGIRINQIGQRENNADSILREFGLDSAIVRSTGFVDYVEGINELYENDVFLIIDNRKGALGTKIYDYIYLNKPVLYVGPLNSSMANLVSSFEYGFCCCRKEDLLKALDRIVSEKIVSLTKHDTNIYSRSSRNSVWINLINQVSNSI